MILNMINFTLRVCMIVIYLASFIYIFGFIITVAVTLFPFAVAFVFGVLVAILVLSALAKYGVL